MRYASAVSRIARVVVPGLPHHVTQRGVRQGETFFRDEDYSEYVSLLADNCRRFDVAVWAWCLMPNHVHLVLVPGDADALAQAVGRTHWRYTRQVNLRLGARGWLWQGRFASCPMERAHALVAVRYVETNPVRARLAERPEDYAWSSARFHLRGEEDGLTASGSIEEEIDDWAEFLRGAEDGEAARLRRSTSTGRPLGDREFVKELEERLGRPLAPRKPGRKPKQERQ